MSKLKLPDYEGMTVRKATMKITNAGADLTDALSIAPKAYRIGQEVHLVLKGVITHVDHGKEKPEDDDLIRKHSLKALEAVEVAQDDVEQYLAEKRERAKAARDAAEGQERIPGVLPEGGKATLRVEKSEGPAGLGKGADFDASQLPTGDAQAELDADPSRKVPA